MRRLALGVVLVIIVVFSAQVCSGAEKVRGSGKVVSEERKVEDFTGVELATIGDLFIEVGEKEMLKIEAEDNLLPYLDAEVRGRTLKIRTSNQVNLKPKKPIRYYLTVKKLDRIVISSAGNIEAPDLKADRFSVISSSAGDLEMGDLDANSLEIEMSSAGDVDIGNVNATTIEVAISSAGDLEMGDLEVSSLEVSMTSAGNARIRNLLAKTFNLDNSSAGTTEIKAGKVEEQEITLSSAGCYRAENLESVEAEVHLSSVGNATINVQDYLSVTSSSMGSVYYVGSPTVESKITSMGKIKKIGN
jgi:hypothetical protein